MLHAASSDWHIETRSSESTIPVLFPGLYGSIQLEFQPINTIEKYVQ